MDAGKLDRKIEFYSLGITSGPTGNTKTETLVLSTWANVRTDISMNRIINAGGIDLQGLTEFIIYQRSTFTPSKSHLIKYNGEKYVIKSITPYREKKDYWRIQARYED